MPDREAGNTRVLVPRERARALPLVARSSLERGPIPTQGVQEASFSWPDLLDGPPPRQRGRGEGAYAVYHGTEIGDDYRVSLSIIVSVDPGADADARDDDVVHVDSRVTVQKRALLELMDRERAFTDRLTSRWREQLGRRLVARRALAARLGGGRATDAALRVVRVEARVNMAAIRFTRRFLRGLVQVPDALASRAIKAQAHLGGRFGRRALMAGLRDPAVLSNEQKGVVLFLLATGLIGTVFLLNTLFALVLTGWIDEYARVVGDATASLLSVLGLPLPSEATVVLSTLTVGPALAFFGSFAGKMIGVLLLYFVGDSLHAKVQAATKGKPRFARAVDWIHANADKHGFVLLVAVNGIPFVPDILLYAFALSGMRFNRYMGGIALGTTLKFVGIIAAVLLLGPERVSEFLANPFTAFR